MLSVEPRREQPYTNFSFHCYWTPNVETVAAVGPERPRDAIPLTVPVAMVIAVLTGETILLESVDDALRAGYDRRTEHLQSGDSAWATVPLKVAGQVIGGLELSFGAARVFGQHDRAFLLVVAAQCAQALQARYARGDVLRPGSGLQAAMSVDRQSRTAAGPTVLSPRERQVLELVAEGLSDQEIADELGISVVTIKTHAAKAREKLDVSGRRRHRALAARAMLIELRSTQNR